MVPTEELDGYARPARARRVIAAVAAVAALSVAAYLALRPADQERPPEFELPLLSGGTLSSRELAGSPVVLNFFASWCEPCRDEAPLLESAWRTYRDNGVRFVGVDVNDTEEDARRFVREFDITYPVVRDANDRLVEALGVYGLPQTFFIDDDWRLLHVASGEEIGSRTRDVVPLGAISEAQLRRNVERLLQQTEDGA